MKNKSIKELVFRLNEILKEQQQLGIKQITLEEEQNKLNQEYNEIVYELWNRIPGLKDEPDIQPRGRVR